MWLICKIPEKWKGHRCGGSVRFRRDGKVIDACFELKRVVKSMPPFWLTGKGAYFFYIIGNLVPVT